MGEDWIGVQEAADLLGVTRQMIHKMIKCKQFEAEQLSERAWMLRRREVVSWPTKRVLVLADMVAKGEGGQLRLMADMMAILTRFPSGDVIDLTKKIRSLAARQKEHGTGSAAERLRGIAECTKTL